MKIQRKKLMPMLSATLFMTAAFVWLAPAVASAQGNAFSFQGRLNDGTTPANGSYDLEFRLYNAATGGTQIGGVISRPNTILINGVFSTTLDYGATAFNNPNSIFIEIAVKPNGSPNTYTILGPRQQLTVVPFAVRAQNATNADNAANAVNAQNAVNATNATNATNAFSLGGVAASEYVTKTNGGTDFIRNSTATQPNSNFNISGNGVIFGNLNIAGNSVIGGNAVQNADKNGLVKATLAVNSDGTIARCYNGTTNSSTGNCGFVIQSGNGIFRINFGFPVSARFVAVTARYFTGPLSENNSGANYREFDNTSIEVFTFKSGDSADTQPRPFTIILF